MPPETETELLTAAGFQAATGVSRETLARLEVYAELLTRRGQEMNLVGRRTLPDLWRRHMLDSAQLWDLLPPPPKTRERCIVDLGSGAGFPGLVLAIMGAGNVHLIESTRKKAAFLHEVAEATGAPATVHAVRIEDAPPLKADVVTSRALAALPKLLGYAAGFCGADTICLFPKGRSAGEELTEARKAWNITVTETPSRTEPESTLLSIAGLARDDTKSRG
jgi:16S rRNA (guanine527-N7)-methyltransferase